MKRISIMIISSSIVALTMVNGPAFAFSGLADCIVSADIGKYTYKVQQSNMGTGSGVVGSTRHFNEDHIDTVCTGGYSNRGELQGLSREELRQKLLIVEVQVTQHAGADSDKWLLHELEMGYRDREYSRLGLLNKGTIIEKINNSKVFRLDISGGSYRWLSNNNVVVSIKYSDPDFAKQEPVAVIYAYLAKFPSTIPATFVLNSAHDIDWIKDEMERRLWLGVKWAAQIQTEDPKLHDKLKTMTDSMVIFLNYREKYYDVNAKDEKIALDTALFQNNIVAVQAKLTTYKTWWTEHKTDPITLP